MASRLLNKMETVIVDGKEAVLGRMGSFVAKELLKGKSVIVVNSGEVIISGKGDQFAAKIQRKRKMGQGSSLKGPKYSAKEDRLLKRIIRGMLPWDKPKGREAHRRLRCYVGDGGLEEKDLVKAVNFQHQKPQKYSYLKDIVRAIK